MGSLWEDRVAGSSSHGLSPILPWRGRQGSDRARTNLIAGLGKIRSETERERELSSSLSVIDERILSDDEYMRAERLKSLTIHNRHMQ